MITIYKNNEQMAVKQRYLSRFLEQGWSQEPPASKKLSRGRVTRAVAEVLPTTDAMVVPVADAIAENYQGDENGNL